MINEAQIQDKNTSEFIRDAVLNELTNLDITKNQSYLSNVFDIIIKNILNEKLQTIDKILESLYLKQELIIFILNKINGGTLDNEIKEFTTTYLGDNQRITLS